MQRVASQKSVTFNERGSSLERSSNKDLNSGQMSSRADRKIISARGVRKQSNNTGSKKSLLSENEKKQLENRRRNID